MAWQVTFSILPLIKILHETLMLRRHYETIAVWDNWDSQFPLTWSGPVCKNRAEGLVHPMLSRKWHCGDSGSQFPLILWVRFHSMHKQNGKLGLSHRTLCLPRETKGRDPHRKMSLRSYLVVSVPSAGLSNVCKAKNMSILVQNKELMCKMHSFDWRPLPPLCPPHTCLGLPTNVQWYSGNPKLCCFGQTECPTCYTLSIPSHPTVLWDGVDRLGSYQSVQPVLTVYPIPLYYGMHTTLVVSAYSHNQKSHVATCIYRVRW